MSGVSETTRGAAAALGAYSLWGLFPLYFHALDAVPPLEVLAHRITGSAIFALAALAATGGMRTAWIVAVDWRQMRPLIASALAISINWGVFIWAVTHAHALEASMGYFMFPLVSLVLARLVLGELLRRRQQAAVAVVTLGAAWLVLAAQTIPWVALILAGSFGAYGLLRKTTPVSALVGLLIEATVLAPAAVLYLACQRGGIGFSLGGGDITLLLLAGPITAIPLWLFAYGARRLRLSTLGLMMYINPAIQMLTALYVLGEAFSTVQAVAFGTIWTGLVLYSWPERRAGIALPHEMNMSEPQ